MIIKISSKPIKQHYAQKPTQIVIIMATKQENIQKVNWWLSELESLGVSPKVRNELNNIQETCFR